MISTERYDCVQKHFIIGNKFLSPGFNRKRVRCATLLSCRCTTRSMRLEIFKFKIRTADRTSVARTDAQTSSLSSYSVSNHCTIIRSNLTLQTSLSNILHHCRLASTALLLTIRTRHRTDVLPWHYKIQQLPIYKIYICKKNMVPRVLLYRCRDEYLKSSQRYRCPGFVLSTPRARDVQFDSIVSI